MRRIIPLLSAAVLAALPGTGAARQADDLAPLVPLTDLPLAPLVPGGPKGAEKREKAPKPAAKPSPARPAPRPTRREAERIVLRGPSGPVRPGQTVSIYVRVHDAAGEPINADLALRVDEGKLSQPAENGPGQYLVTYTAPRNAEPGSSAIIRGEVRGASKPVSSHLTVFFAQPSSGFAVSSSRETEPKRRPVRAVFPDRIDARSDEVVRIRFRLEDESGRLAAPTGLKLFSEGGRFANFASERDSYVVEFIAHEDVQGEFAVFAQASNRPLAGEGTVVITGSPKEAARAAKLQLGAFTGALFRQGKVDSNGSFDGVIVYKPARAFGIGLQLGYGPANAKQIPNIANPNLPSADFSMSIFSVLARAGVSGRLGPVSLHAGGLAGLSFVSGQVNRAESSPSFSQSLFDRGAYAGAGLALGPGQAVLELRWRNIPLERQEAPVIRKSYLGGTSLQAGYLFEL